MNMALSKNWQRKRKDDDLAAGEKQGVGDRFCSMTGEMWSIYLQWRR